VAQEDDTVDDATVRWYEERTLLEIGKITLMEPVADNAHEQQHTFDPNPRVERIEPSADLLLELRAVVCLLRGRRRRKADE
jgi:catalase